ncbi:MAG: hypothetical protein JXR94_02500, partial [Candidatus Hydrogenedentes bacterium]|nr:hypothetical protein [Candidatus Hydrogenedentota bacterium]
MGMLATLVTIAAMCGASRTDAADLQGLVNEALTGGPATSLDCQRAIVEMLGRRAESASGVVAGGEDVSVKDLDPARAQDELATDAPVARFFEVDGRGPEPIRVSAPLAAESGEVEVYRRVSRGLYVRLGDAPRKLGGRVWFTADRPGRFIVRTVDEYSSPTLDAKFLDFGPSSSEPEAKAEWRLYPLYPELVAGPVPVVLIHGMGATRWGEFAHWAAYSPDAAAFRAAFQLWDFDHPASGVNAAIGFSALYPGFEESIAAYLARFLAEATSEGVESGGVRYYFPEGAYAIVTHSLGGLKARAFLHNYPEHAERVAAVVTIAAPHTGSPWGTPEWLR